jgi:hypothetical protein
MRHISDKRRIRLPQLAIAALFATATALALGAHTLAIPSIARAEKVWDIETYDDCMNGVAGDQINTSINQQKFMNQKCCEYSGGVFQDDGYLGKCVAPPAEPAPAGSRHDTSDIGTETLTPSPPRTHAPSDIGTATFTPAATPTPPPTPATTQAPPVNPCLIPQEPICRN